MIVLAILFGSAILFHGGWFEAVYGSPALRLDLPGSAIIPSVPWLTLTAYLLAVFAIIKFKVRWRWASFVGVTMLGHVAILYPVLLLYGGSARIPVVDFLNRESRQALEAKYPVLKWAYLSSSEGRCVHVRRDDYSPELAAFVTGLAAHQAGSSKDPAR